VQESQRSVSAETFSEAVEEEEPTRFQDLLQHPRANALVAITCIPHWHGEDFDYGMAIAALLQRAEPGRQRINSDLETESGPLTEEYGPLDVARLADIFRHNLCSNAPAYMAGE
jgi:hypothetical protein